MDATAGTRNEEQQAAQKPHWAGEKLRLDPFQMPHKVSYERAKLSSRGMTPVNVTLDVNGATMKREMDCGLPLSLSLPAKAFQGVAARAFENNDGTTTVTLELRHMDAELSVPLCVSDNMEDTACDWHSWARALNLPMLMIDQNGEAQVVKNAGLETENTPRPRRRRVTALKYRPNFLRRRKPGIVGPIVVLDAREIIART
ncbi:MAG: hypothetical protein COC23_02060 [Hyphomicrobiales bacterium]|nr:MAG: hypothetical protein COC23_02060 [Hyphomicrobiales bacterium]